MSHAKENLGLSDEDLVDVDKEVIEHALWFGAEETLDDKAETPPSEKKEEGKEDTTKKRQEAQPKQDKITEPTYHALIEAEDKNLHLILRAHFLEHLHKPTNANQRINFQDALKQYHAYFDDDIAPNTIEISKLIEAHYLLDDFLEEADNYDDNPVYFLKKTTHYPMPPDILDKAQNMSDEEIIFLLAAFCIYDPEDEDTLLKDPKTIKSKDIMSIIQKLAAIEQIN